MRIRITILPDGINFKPFSSTLPGGLCPGADYMAKHWGHFPPDKRWYRFGSPNWLLLQDQTQDPRPFRFIKIARPRPRH